MLTDFQFTVDEDYARSHNEFFRDAKRLQISAAVLGVLVIGIAAAIWFVQGGATPVSLTSGFALLFFALLCFIVIPVLPRQMGKPQQYYDMYQLAPAVVAKVNPRDIVLLSLVNATAGRSRPAQPALAARTVTSIPGTAREVGARVPSMAVTGVQSPRSQGRFEEISPMPVAWGTRDQKIWKKAESAIPAQQWKALDSLIDRVDEVVASKRSLLLLDKSDLKHLK